METQAFIATITREVNIVNSMNQQFFTLSPTSQELKRENNKFKFSKSFSAERLKLSRKKREGIEREGRGRKKRDR